MSRMLAFASDTPITFANAVGARTLTEFAALASLHSDGAGTAGIDSGGQARRTVSASQATVDTPLVDSSQLLSGALYLRLASDGSGVTAENVQPFVREDVAFCHNGALVPGDRIQALLTERERAQLLGTTDSEHYFLRILRHLRECVRDVLPTVVDAVDDVRAAFPDACLNAYVLHPVGLFVIQSAGTRPAPVAAFRRRGVDEANLPPGHGEKYNQLFLRQRGDVVTIATTGVDVRGWRPLDEDTVTHVRGGSIRTATLRPAPTGHTPSQRSTSDACPGPGARGPYSKLR